ncbi:MAG: hypothetical protein ACKVS6_12670 [Planctomycetota bacterium]
MIKKIWRYVILPMLVMAGLVAIIVGLVEGPALQPFLYGVF